MWDDDGVSVCLCVWVSVPASSGCTGGKHRDLKHEVHPQFPCTDEHDLPSEAPNWQRARALTGLEIARVKGPPTGRRLVAVSTSPPRRYWSSHASG